MDLTQHLKRQIAFSKGTFGPGERTNGILAHMRKEIEEVAESEGSASEWVDLVILAFDGLTRSFLAEGYNTDGAALMAVKTLEAKQAANESREWPDWRQSSQDEPIEHVRAAGLEGMDRVFADSVRDEDQVQRGANETRDGM